MQTVVSFADNSRISSPSSTSRSHLACICLKMHHPSRCPWPTLRVRSRLLIPVSTVGTMLRNRDAFHKYDLLVGTYQVATPMHSTRVCTAPGTAWPGRMAYEHGYPISIPYVNHVRVTPLGGVRGPGRRSAVGGGTRTTFYRYRITCRAQL